MTSFPRKKLEMFVRILGPISFFFVSVEGNPNVHQFGNNSGTFFCLLGNLANKDDTVNQLKHSFIQVTRKYPLCGYILGVLTHTTAWDQHWGGDETLN